MLGAILHAAFSPPVIAGGKRPGCHAGWRLVRVSLLLIPVLLTAPARGGGNPLRVAVVVNDASPESLALGQYYHEQRGIPASQVIHLSTTTGDEISLAAYTNEVAGPVEVALGARGLTGQVDTLVFTRGLPYRVRDGSSTNGITSAALYGFHAYPAAPVCTLPGGTAHAYFAAGEAFDAQDRSQDGLGYLSAMLTAPSLEGARTLVDRSLAADGTMPTGTVYMVHSTDPLRNVHWPQFEDAAFDLRLLRGPGSAWIGDGNQLVDRPSVVGQMIGLARPQGLETNTYVPGALADHLTSFGGVLYDSSQMSILAWLEAGCVASYGTVVEPCNYTNKFPNARLHVDYARGFSAGEAYTMAVRNPYMGILVGDPLCAPYAVPPQAGIDGLSPDEVVRGSINLQITGAATADDQVVRQLDVYLDDRFLATVVREDPVAGETVAVTIDGTERAYSIQAGDDLADIARGLEQAVDLAPSLPVAGQAHADWLRLLQVNLGEPGDGLTYGAEASPGSRILAATAGATMTESPFFAMQMISLSGTVGTNDDVCLVVTRVDGLSVTNRVTAEPGDRAVDLMTRLRDAVNQDPALQGPEGVQLAYLTTSGNGRNADAAVVARSSGWRTTTILLEYGVTSSTLSGPDYAGPPVSNRDTMVARGMILLACGSAVLTGPLVLDTTTLADGPHRLTAAAREGSSVGSQGLHTVSFTVDNHDLACRILEPGPDLGVLEDQMIRFVAEAEGGVGSVTSMVFRIEGVPIGAIPAAAGSFEVPAAAYGEGTLSLQVEARTDRGEATLSDPVSLRVLGTEDRDLDGIPDGWETWRFGSITATDGTVDTDLDGQSDEAEFLADTHPRDPTSRFTILAIDPRTQPGHTILEYVSSPFRTYLVESAAGTPPTEWVSSAPTPGTFESTLTTNTTPQAATAQWRIRVDDPKRGQSSDFAIPGRWW